MFNLTYSICTYNKINSLKNIINTIIKEKNSDEEIIVVDGGSTDGTLQYLQKLKNDNLIDNFISEKDFGESHAVNKGLLLSNGKIIKTLTDDDAFSFAEIKKCKNYMIENNDIDILSTEGCVYTNENNVALSGYTNIYKKWLTDRTPFSFCGLGTLIRKKSLPLIGLYNPNFARVDHEFSLRITSSNIKLGWYCGYTWARLHNPKSNSNLYYDRIQQETLFLDKVYFNRPTNERITPLIKSKYDNNKLINDSYDNINEYNKAINWLNGKNKISYNFLS